MPDDLTPTKSIAYEWGNDSTLDDLIKTFTAAADGQHLRWTQAKGFHTHRKYEFSGVDILARVGLTHWRDQRRADAVVKLRAFITEKYGKDVAERVLGAKSDDPKTSITKEVLSRSVRGEDLLIKWAERFRPALEERHPGKKFTTAEAIEQYRQDNRYPISKEEFLDMLRGHIRYSEQFGDLKKAGIVDELNEAVGGETTEDVTPPGEYGVANIFAQDINRADSPILLNGVSLNNIVKSPTSVDSDISQFPRVKEWNKYMRKERIAGKDSFIFSKIINQNTIHFFLGGDPIPTLLRSVHPLFNFTERQWRIDATESGYNISFEGSGPVKQLPAEDGKLVELHESQSTVSLKFTIVLQRNTDTGLLEPKEVENVSHTMVGVLKDWKALLEQSVLPTVLEPAWSTSSNRQPHA